ncbi:methyltransferase domain-containing protein [Kribbella sp. NPDC000426]|uniref:class I SAM-dependent methyltransferase n=1 Tax=Kribbella sp. NPDC000426 TaxID=3154255 RepID=UPI0033288837
MHTVKHRFTEWAPTYGDDALSQLLVRLSRQALLSMRLTAADRFLDVGCGTGALVHQASRTVGWAVGVDACPAMVERARQLDHRARLAIADAHRLPFDDGTFTAVTCSSTARHFHDLDGAVQEMTRVLASRGQLCIADLFADPAPRRPGRSEPLASATAALRSCGLTVARPLVQLTPFGPYFIARATKPGLSTN